MKLILLPLLAGITTFVCSQTISDDRTVNWQMAGLTGDCYTPTQIINFTDAGGNGDGVTPNDAVIAGILDTISASFTAIYFPPGNFYFQSGIALKSNMVLKGAGAAYTTLTFNLNIPTDAITIKGGETGTQSYCTTNIFKGTNAIPVEDASGFEPGDYVELFEQDAMLVTSDWAFQTTGQIFKIESIAGDTLFADMEIRRDFFTSREVQLKQLNMKTNTGIEDMSIVRQDQTVKNFSNIYFKYAAECWVRGVASYGCNYAHIELHTTTHSEVSGCYVQDAYDYGDGGRAYGVVIHYTSGDNLITGNIFNHLRHSMLLQAGANGNVVSYNYSINPYWTDTWLPSSSAGDLVLHGNYPYANLFEGNTVQNIVIDDSHGANGRYNTFFRNRAELYGIFMSSAAAGGYQNFVGNEITNDGLLLGLYDLSGSGHFEYGNNITGTIQPAGTDDLPESTLYQFVPGAFYTLESEFPPIGTPEPPDNFVIESQMRYTENVLTVGAECNSKILLVEGTDNTAYCNGDSMHIYFDVAGLFDAGNVFSAQLLPVDAGGSAITLEGTTADGEITCGISDVPQGNYYVRILAGSPPFTGLLSKYSISVGNNSATAIEVELDDEEVYMLPDGSDTAVIGIYVFHFTNSTGCDSVVTITLTGDDACTPPAEMDVLMTTATSAKISWSAADESDLFMLLYRAEGTVPWQKKFSYYPRKLLTGLIPSATYQYKVRAKCDDTWTDFSEVHTLTTLSLRESVKAEDNALHIFPNPGNGKLNGSYSAAYPFLVEIFDINGQKIYSQNFDSGMFQIDLQGSAPGLYVLHLLSGEGNAVIRSFIIQ